jgi:thymidylate synthase
MFSAWVSNAMGLRALQGHIRDEIANRSSFELTLGALIVISQSAHIYDDCWDNAEMLIENHYGNGRRDYYDACGNFIIEVCEHEITVTQTSPNSGEVVMIYKGKTPLTIIREIAANSPAIAPEHIGYLGIELEKARVLGVGYHQQ